MLRRARELLELPVCLSHVAMGARLGQRDGDVDEFLRDIQCWKSWEPRHVSAAEEFLLPVMVDYPSPGRGRVLLAVTSRWQGASELSEASPGEDH